MLAEKVAEITPGNLKQSFFTNSGTEANEAAILLARMSTGNFDVVALRHTYSGGSSLAKGENLLENAHVVGTYFRGKLEELQQKHASIGDVRGMGLMQALELVKDRKTKEPAPEATTQVMERARQNGLLIGKGGLYGNVLRLAPMLNPSKSDVDEAVRILDKSFFEVPS